MLSTVHEPADARRAPLLARTQTALRTFATVTAIGIGASGVAGRRPGHGDASHKASSSTGSPVHQLPHLVYEDMVSWPVVVGCICSGFGLGCYGCCCCVSSRMRWCGAQLWLGAGLCIGTYLGYLEGHEGESPVQRRTTAVPQQADLLGVVAYITAALSALYFVSAPRHRKIIIAAKARAMRHVVPSPTRGVRPYAWCIPHTSSPAPGSPCIVSCGSAADACCGRLVMILWLRDEGGVKAVHALPALLMLPVATLREQCACRVRACRRRAARLDGRRYLRPAGLRSDRHLRRHVGQLATLGALWMLVFLRHAARHRRRRRLPVVLHERRERHRHHHPVHGQCSDRSATKARPHGFALTLNLDLNLNLKLDSLLVGSDPQPYLWPPHNLH